MRLIDVILDVFDSKYPRNERKKSFELMGF